MGRQKNTNTGTCDLGAEWMHVSDGDKERTHGGQTTCGPHSYSLLFPFGLKHKSTQIKDPHPLSLSVSGKLLF